MKLKIMEYNILNGFTKEIDEDRLIYEKEREENAVKIVREFDPDVLVISESSFTFKHKEIWPNNSISIDYKKIFGFRYCNFVIKNKEDGTTILSKYPIKTKDYSIDQRAFGRTIVKIKGNEITIDSIHPHPTRVDNFEKARWIKGVLRDKKNPYILIGDFNAVSREDKYEKEYLIEFFKPFKKEHLYWEVEKIMKCEMIDEVLKNELKDTFKVKNKKFDYTCPTAKYKMNGQENKGIRIDYIFCSKDFKVMESGIIKNELTESTSDHYPIYAVLELK